MDRSQQTPASSAAGRDLFLTTRWSVVQAAGDSGTAQRQQALVSLCEAYWMPLYAYARRRTASVDEAQDLTQAFFAEFLEKDFVCDADPLRGRFRAFLLVAFKHFMAKQWRAARAAKRGGGKQQHSIDFAAAEGRLDLEPLVTLTAEQLYDRHWALSLLDKNAAPDGLKLGYDTKLLRKVWIRTYEQNRPPASSPLRRVSRIGRLHWLAGHRGAEGNWDAFDAPAGRAFLDITTAVSEQHFLRLHPEVGELVGYLGLYRSLPDHESPGNKLPEPALGITFPNDALSPSERAKVREAIGVVIAHRYHQTVEDVDLWNDPTIAEFLTNDDRELLLSFLRRHPSPSREQVDTAEATLAPYQPLLTAYGWNEQDYTVFGSLVAFVIGAVGALLFIWSSFPAY